MVSACPNCDGRSLYRSRKKVSAGGGYSPDTLPGLGTFFSSAKVEIVLCGECGLIRHFATEDALAKLQGSGKWEPI